MSDMVLKYLGYETVDASSDICEKHQNVSAIVSMESTCPQIRRTISIDPSSR